MNSQLSGCRDALRLLHPNLQKWIWEQRWCKLTAVQQLAIPILSLSNDDVIISAQTASGKTEAVFLPLVSKFLVADLQAQLILHVCPYKSLINDQYDRITRLCASLNIPVYAWHGDIPSSRKQKFFKSPRGIVIITPESLESFFVNRGSQLSRLFRNVKSIVIDEFHALIESERGRQLLSLLHRLELIVGRRVQRIALSATLGDISLAAECLRSDGRVKIVNCPSNDVELLVSVKAYYVSAAPSGLTATTPSHILDIATSIFEKTRGTKNLIFPNSRQNVELYTSALRAINEDKRIANCFWPHHGSLSLELRLEAEQNLKAPLTPANVVATNSLENGIDYKEIKSIFQIGRPPSVSSLRQRIGRSGRTAGTPAILRMYTLLETIGADSDISAQLHIDLIQSIACIELMRNSFYEPPRTAPLQLSTLVHQVLSSIAQHGSRDAVTLWRDLILSGPHKGLSKPDFKALLISLGAHNLIEQDADGSLLLGSVGERLTNMQDFYGVFPSAEEYSLHSSGGALGTITKEALLAPGQIIIFAGRRWKILNIQKDRSVIEVEEIRTMDGESISFGGGALYRHPRVVDAIRKVLAETNEISYIDDVAKLALNDARKVYKSLALSNRHLFAQNENLIIFTWAGDLITHTIAHIFSLFGLTVYVDGFCIYLKGLTKNSLANVCSQIARIENPFKIFEDIDPPEYHRWDWALPKDLLRRDFISRACDVPNAIEFIRLLLESLGKELNSSHSVDE